VSLGDGVRWIAGGLIVWSVLCFIIDGIKTRQSRRDWYKFQARVGRDVYRVYRK
jgi:hypothetical protein